MTQHSSTDLAVVAHSQIAPKTSAAKRLAKAAGAAVLSVGLVGTFALPAYATFEQPEGTADGFTQVASAPAQSLSTGDLPEAAAALPGNDLGKPDDSEAVALKEKAEAEAAAKKAAEEAAAEAAEAQQAAAGASPEVSDVPSGKGASAIVNAARAQLGDMQDCTALVERSLRAAGIPAGDLGTQVGEYTALGGTQVSTGALAPGDVLIWPGAHVAIYIGNGQAVHGGWNGNQTVIASINTGTGGMPSAAVRF